MMKLVCFLFVIRFALLEHVSSVLALGNIIETNMESLVENIDVKNTTLWYRLMELRLLDSGDVEYIKVRKLNFLYSCVI